MSEPQGTTKAACGRSDSTEVLATEFNPMADGELHDNGPWVASDDGRAIHSDDFTHDATLRVIGDFYDDEQRKAYSDNLVAKLNAVPAGLTFKFTRRRKRAKPAGDGRVECSVRPLTSRLNCMQLS